MTTTLVFYSNCFGPADEAPGVRYRSNFRADCQGSHRLGQYCYVGGVGLELHRTILSELRPKNNALHVGTVAWRFDGDALPVEPPATRHHSSGDTRWHCWRH